MTSGYEGQSHHEPTGTPVPGFAPQSAPGQGGPARSGPLPPRLHPSWGTPTPPGPPYGPASGPPSIHPVSHPAPPQAAYPPQPAAQPVPPIGPYVPAPATAGPGPVGRRTGGWAGISALVLSFVLLGVTGFQAYQIHQLSDRLDTTDRRLNEAQSGDAARLDRLEGRAGELEKQAGSVFNPEAISSAVLPSVFRVAAGSFTGTAFAVGKPASDGGTNLFTNFHVVESLWDAGKREVFLERRDERYPATIVKVDKDNDVAHLKTSSRFTGLVAASAAVKSGQQIIVVGAPLGLEDSVTTGVVSAFRKAQNGTGTVIQFDAPINPGNSGGPVINSEKQVVGIATAKARDAEGIGLAVPIKTACDEFKIC